MRKLISTGPCKNKRIAYMLANARKDHSIPLHSNYVAVINIGTVMLYYLIIFLNFSKSHFFRRYFHKRFLTVDLTLACEMGIFIVTLALVCILITERCDRARGDDICVAKRFFFKQAQGKPL